ncbi:hypothetical protein KUTeg_015054 [Tegillarca granosa]|uniref:Uncharacterized protein n=1 Tax=Tegillarca granosa TaxID=220873 RepID=A0ABQ9ETM2_TEGGR|nr:hypothetical protein KUTeg_015054 [Tegillarca granosa]
MNNLLIGKYTCICHLFLSTYLATRFQYLLVFCNRNDSYGVTLMIFFLNRKCFSLDLKSAKVSFGDWLYVHNPGSLFLPVIELQ